MAGIAIFVYRCFNRVVNIDISEKKSYKFNRKRCAILSISIKNISRISLAKPNIIITRLIYSNDFIDYLNERGIGSIGELVPVIGIDGLNPELFKLLLEFTISTKGKSGDYFENKWRYLLKKIFKFYEMILIKSIAKNIFGKSENKNKVKKIVKDIDNVRKEFYSIYDVLDEYIEQFKLDNDNLDNFLKHIISISSERVLKTSKRIIPNENLTVDRLYIFNNSSFIHLGAQLRFGRIKKGRRTSTTFAGLRSF